MLFKKSPLAIKCAVSSIKAKGSLFFPVPLWQPNLHIFTCIRVLIYSYNTDCTVPMLVSTTYSLPKCNCSPKLSLLSSMKKKKTKKRNELLEAMTHHKPEHLLYSFWNASPQDLVLLLEAGPPFCWSHPRAVGSSGTDGDWINEEHGPAKLLWGAPPQVPSTASSQQGKRTPRPRLPAPVFSANLPPTPQTCANKVDV